MSASMSVLGFTKEKNNKSYLDDASEDIPCKCPAAHLIT
jgi:hypothetical protein